MSDALTDIARDERRGEISREISRAERDFLRQPGPDRAKKLIELWKQYIYIPSGYWTSSNETLAYERIGLYDRYLQTGEIPDLPDVKLDKDPPGVIDTVVRVGEGFIVDRIGDRILNEIYKACGPTNFRNFHIRLVVEKVEEVTCKRCPELRNICLGNYGCNSKRPDELAERRALVEVGKQLSYRKEC